MELKVKKLQKSAKLPTRAHEVDSGADVYSVEQITIQAGQVKPVHTGIAIQPPEPKHFRATASGPVSERFRKVIECQVRPKSGLAMNNQLTVLNTPGTVDNQYRGEVIVLLQNHSKTSYTVKKGQKIAQIVLALVYIPNIVEVEELGESTRNTDGFGSTGL